MAGSSSDALLFVGCVSSLRSKLGSMVKGSSRTRQVARTAMFQCQCTLCFFRGTPTIGPVGNGEIAKRRAQTRSHVHSSGGHVAASRRAQTRANVTPVYPGTVARRTAQARRRAGHILAAEASLCGSDKADVDPMAGPSLEHDIAMVALTLNAGNHAVARRAKGDEVGGNCLALENIVLPAGRAAMAKRADVRWARLALTAHAQRMSRFEISDFETDGASTLFF